ncbi:putative methyltransferase At1g22800 [Momordica charantia]|uniref:Methyltransferase At1g22800 n=1 Tax=Momordica charantia TaxID=3673 RepID=A0A6J1CJP6_MOMCH|nr:putative methyltransferase At1g22800 [Momordica charantia]
MAPFGNMDNATLIGIVPSLRRFWCSGFPFKECLDASLRPKPIKNPENFPPLSLRRSSDGDREMRGLSPPRIIRSFSLLRSTRRRDDPRSILCSSFSTGDDNYDSSISNGMQSSKVKIFDRDLKRKQRDRAAWLMRPKDSLVDTVAENLLDRLEDCKKTFPEALCLGGSLEAIRRLLRGRGSVEKLIMMDASHDMIKLCKDDTGAHDQDIETSFIVGDEEFLPIKESSVDLVISCLGLHWTNDLPGAVIQSRLALKPDGLFLAAIFGGETLKELRIACTLAQMEREGGISPRVSPLAQVRDAGNLLTRAGFTLPGVDVDEYVVRYPNALDLVEHLRAMGETNALLQRNPILKRETALATAAIYDSMFAAEDGTIPATFQVIYMTGWKEHSSQQKAKRRGSATISFTDIKKQFGTDT